MRDWIAQSNKFNDPTASLKTDKWLTREWWFYWTFNKVGELWDKIFSMIDCQEKKRVSIEKKTLARRIVAPTTPRDSSNPPALTVHITDLGCDLPLHFVSELQVEQRTTSEIQKWKHSRSSQYVFLPPTTSSLPRPVNLPLHVSLPWLSNFTNTLQPK